MGEMKLNKSHVLKASKLNIFINLIKAIFR